MRTATPARYQGKHVKPSLHPTRSTLSAGLTAVLLPLCMASPALAEGEPSPSASATTSEAPYSPSPEATPSESASAQSTATATTSATPTSSRTPAAKAQTELRLTGPTSTVSPGAHTVSVRLLAGSRAVRNGYVRLERKHADGSWGYVGRLLTSADGVGSGRVELTRTTRLRAVYQGSATRTAAVSREIVVSVASFRQKAVQVAAQQNGKPYRYGSVGPNSFDCSGLVKYAFAQAGKALPRTSRDMFAATQRVSPSQKKPGDLIFMSTNGRIGHVAVYAGDGMMWDAPTAGRNVSKRRIYSASYYVGRVN